MLLRIDEKLLRGIKGGIEHGDFGNGRREPIAITSLKELLQAKPSR